VKEFEKAFKEYVGCDYVVAVNSGTAALHLALSLYNIKGKEVILPAMSFVSTANAILYNGGIPVFADIKQSTLCLDFMDVNRKVTDKTAAIIPVHFGGMPCNDLFGMSRFHVIQDAAHAAGSILGGSRIGAEGQAVCFSFHPIKNLAMPNGGAICLNNIDPLDVEKLKARRWCGITDREGMKYDVQELGWNYYMNEISAAIGLEQLKKLDDHNLRRYEIARRYHDELDRFFRMPLDSYCSYHLYWIRVKGRRKFIQKMQDHDIEVGIHYTPIDHFKLYKRANLPVTDMVAPEIVSLPIHPGMSDDMVSRVIKVANS